MVGKLGLEWAAMMVALLVYSMGMMMADPKVLMTVATMVATMAGQRDWLALMMAV
jgi:hypothetical protein